MTGWTLLNLVFIVGIADVALVAAEHLFRSPPSPKRRREARLVAVVSGLAVLGFGLAHLQLSRNWGAGGIEVANWWWLAYALGFSAALWAVHGAFRYWRFDVDDVILAVVGVAMLLGLLNVWIWETRDANAFVSQVALPEMRAFEQRVQADPDLDPALREGIIEALGVVPDELGEAAAGRPANVLHQSWVDGFNAARDRYQAATELAPTRIPTTELRPVVVDNVFRRQLYAAVLALAVIPGLSVVVFLASHRPWAHRGGLVGASVILVALGALAIGQGTFGRLPAFVQLGGVAVTVFSLSALVLVVALSTVANTSRHERAYQIGGGLAIAVMTVSMISIDTGAGLLLALVVGATVVTRLTRHQRRVVYLACFALVVVVVRLVAADGVSFLPDRAAARLAAWTDPWTTHHQAEIENAGVLTVQAMADLGDEPGADQLRARTALALIEQELVWRLDSVDDGAAPGPLGADLTATGADGGSPGGGTPGGGALVGAAPVIPRTEVEERVVHLVELLWSDLGGYDIDPTDPDAPTVDGVEARATTALGVIGDAVDALPPFETSIGELSATARPDGLQYQRSLQALGAGGLLGSGLGNGRPESVPEVTEDMAIVFVGEAFGFVGIVLTVGLVVLVAVRTIERAGAAPGPRAEAVAGLGLLVGVQALVNLGGVTGTIPLTGIPFPFISRTGTGAVVLAVGVAMTLALDRRCRANAPPDHRALAGTTGEWAASLAPLRSAGGGGRSPAGQHRRRPARRPPAGAGAGGGRGPPDRLRSPHRQRPLCPP